MKSIKVAALWIAGVITMFIPILMFIPIRDLTKNMDILIFVCIILTAFAICNNAGLRLLSNAIWLENEDFYKRIGK